MALIRANSNGGGGAINPTAIVNGYIAKNGTTTCPIDATKTYILSMCPYYDSNDAYMAEFEIVKGGTPTRIDSGTWTPIAPSISGSTLTITNGSSAFNVGYCLVQLDYLHILKRKRNNLTFYYITEYDILFAWKKNYSNQTTENPKILLEICGTLSNHT